MGDDGTPNAVELHADSTPSCPDCHSQNTYEDDDFRLHCLDCGEVNDAYIQRGPA
jgi:transcription initiation factor TFIIIB Brf1 subunit/transcription initiation factor TFIIB